MNYCAYKGMYQSTLTFLQLLGGKVAQGGMRDPDVTYFYYSLSLPLSSGQHSLAPPFQCPLRIKGTLYQLLGFVATTVGAVRGGRAKSYPRKRSWNHHWFRAKGLAWLSFLGTSTGFTLRVGFVQSPELAGRFDALGICLHFLWLSG